MSIIKETNKFQFGKQRDPADYPAERRVMERRTIVVNSTKRLLSLLIVFVFALVTGVSITGIIVYSRFEELNRKLMVENLSVSPTDISVGQPIDSFEVEEEPPVRRSR